VIVDQHPSDDVDQGASETPLTEVLLDQFAAYYTLVITAFDLLQEARKRATQKELQQTKNHSNRKNTV
jgi:hypothetical protein